MVVALARNDGSFVSVDGIATVKERSEIVMLPARREELPKAPR